MKYHAFNTVWFSYKWISAAIGLSAFLRAIARKSIQYEILVNQGDYEQPDHQYADVQQQQLGKLVKYGKRPI